MIVLIWGSSPLTRGKRVIESETAPLWGLIPAHAGKTRRGRRHREADGAHPRSRGENGGARARGDRRPGSSPLTRGKLIAPEGASERPGLIPAHAGKTRSDHGRRNRARAHPRSRGENLRVRRSGSDDEGSSPLTRGKPQLQTARRNRRGLIPAHAGKTSQRLPLTDGMRAHPRSRGENTS